MPCALIAEACLEASLKLHFCHIYVKSPNFIGLHAFYGDAYSALDGWFDRFAERARAEGEAGVPLDAKVSVPRGDCIKLVTQILEDLETDVEALREKEDTTTQAMCDELLEYLGKLLWQLDSMS